MAGRRGERPFGDDPASAEAIDRIPEGYLPVPGRAELEVV